MLKTFFKNKRLLIGIAALLLMLAGMNARGKLTSSLSTEKPEVRWSSDGTSCGYVAAYYPAGEGISLDTIKGYRVDLDKALTEASVEGKDNARKYLDAYSVDGNADVYGTRNRTATTVNVTAIGGDFFFIHPEELLSGSYISENDLMKDRVVIDEATAWRLYGSTDISGKYLMIGSDSYYIAGVVRPHDSSAAKKTYGSRGRIYMLVDAYEKIEENVSVTCYEIVYPDMITNFAYNTLRDILGLSETGSSAQDDAASAGNDENIDVINMSTRFRIFSIWNVICSYGERSSHSDGIIYPYWENEYRRTEDFEAVILLVNLLLAAVVAVIAVLEAVGLYKKYKPVIIDMAKGIIKRIDLLRDRKRYKEDKNE